MSSPSQNRQNQSNIPFVHLIEFHEKLFLKAYRQTIRLFRSGFEICAKIPYASVAASKRLTRKSCPSLVRESIVPSLNVPVVKVQQCDEEFDETPREAKFAFRKTDLKSWKNSSGETNTNSDSAPIQHWAVVIHFPRGNLTYVFEAYEDEETGKLEGYRARHVDYEVFEKAKEFGTADTSPRELLELAKKVKSNGTEYNPIDNNCQTWLKEFLRNISQNLCQSFERLLVELNLPIIVGFFLFLIVLGYIVVIRPRHD